MFTEAEAPALHCSHPGHRIVLSSSSSFLGSLVVLNQQVSLSGTCTTLMSPFRHFSFVVPTLLLGKSSPACVLSGGQPNLSIPLPWPW